MAEKGFDIKVLIPTDDGLTISEKRIENALYYLMYNVSNRSYQLAGKLKQSELDKSDFNTLMKKENIDFIMSNTAIQNINVNIVKAEFSEINQILNYLIDQIDQKNVLV